LVIAHCTKAKRVDWAKVREALAAAGLPIPGMDLDREEEYKRALAEFVKPAEEMYGGSFYAARALAERLRGCGLETSLYVISARYGLIPGRKPVVPYEATLSGMGRDEIRAWAEARGVPQAALELAEKYDVVALLLTRPYAEALGPALAQLLGRDDVYAVLPAALAKGRANVVVSKGLFARRRQVEELAEMICSRYGKYIAGL
jgi:hypothetical protein